MKKMILLFLLFLAALSLSAQMEGPFKHVIIDGIDLITGKEFWDQGLNLPELVTSWEVGNGARFLLLDNNGYLYVSLFGKGGIEKYDFDGHLIKTWGQKSDWGEWNSPEHLPYPQEMAFDPNGNLYVLESNQLGIFIKLFSPDGSFISQFPTSYRSPIATDKLGNVYQSTTGFKNYSYVDSVYRSKSDHVWKMFIPDCGFNDRINRPADGLGNIAFDHEGNIYVTNYKKIQKYNAKGEKVGQITTNNPDRFYPCALAFDLKNNLYVINKMWFDCDYRVDIFDSMGRYLTGWFGNEKGLFTHSSENLYSRNCKSYLKSRDEKKPILGTPTPVTETRFHTPAGIAVDDKGFIYVLDSGFNRIFKFKPLDFNYFHAVLDYQKRNPSFFITPTPTPEPVDDTMGD